MKILIAPDSFKGSLSAKGVTDAIERGIKKVLVDAIIHKVPMADGGEGTVETLVEATNGSIVEAKVLDPLGQEHLTYFGIFDNGQKLLLRWLWLLGYPW